MTDTTQEQAADDAAEGRYARGPFDFAAFAVEEPGPVFLEVQESGPFREDGVVVVTKMADILATTKRRDVVSNGSTSIDEGESMLGNERPLIPLQIDGAEHTKFRKLLDPLFAPRVVAHLEPHVADIANELIDRFIDQPEIEFYEAFCVPLPSRIFLELMGLPDDMIDDFLEFKDAAIRPQGASPEEQKAYQHRVIGRMNDYLNAEFDRRLAAEEPGDDLIGGFLSVEIDGDRLTREEILDIVFLLLIAGLDTVSSALSNMVAYLARHPEQRQQLVDDPTMLPGRDRGAAAHAHAGSVRRPLRHLRLRRERQGREGRRHDRGAVGGRQRRSRDLPRPVDRRLPPSGQPTRRLCGRVPPLSRIAPRTHGAPGRARRVARTRSRVRDRSRERAGLQQRRRPYREPAAARHHDPRVSQPLG